MKGSDIVRKAKGSGKWFPADGKALVDMLEQYTGDIAVPEVSGRIVSMIVPHAGYVYSGKVAGSGFCAAERNIGDDLDCVVVLGFSHSQRFRGLALMDGDGLETPLGLVGLDRSAGDVLVSGSDLIFYDYDPHNGEHSAENEIPFVQHAFPGVKIVVGIMGDHSEETVNAVVAALERLAKQRKVLLVASSDMLHDESYDVVTATDRQTLAVVESMNSDAVRDAWSIRRQIFCGIGPVLCAMKFGQVQGCRRAEVLKYRNSGDDFPESRGQWVVGYSSIVFVRD